MLKDHLAVLEANFTLTLSEWRKLLKTIDVKVSVRSSIMCSSCAKYDVPEIFCIKYSSDSLTKDQKLQEALKDPDFSRNQKLKQLIKDNFDAVQKLAKENEIVNLTLGYKSADQITVIS